MSGPLLSMFHQNIKFSGLLKSVAVVRPAERFLKSWQWKYKSSQFTQEAAASPSIFVPPSKLQPRSMKLLDDELDIWPGQSRRGVGDDIKVRSTHGLAEVLPQGDRVGWGKEMRGERRMETRPPDHYNSAYPPRHGGVVLEPTIHKATERTTGFPFLAMERRVALECAPSEAGTPSVAEASSNNQHSVPAISAKNDPSWRGLRIPDRPDAQAGDINPACHTPNPRDKLSPSSYSERKITEPPASSMAAPGNASARASLAENSLLRGRDMPDLSSSPAQALNSGGAGSAPQRNLSGALWIDTASLRSWLDPYLTIK